MERAGTPKAPAETPWEFAYRLRESRPADEALVRTITERYYEIRFARK